MMSSYAKLPFFVTTILDHNPDDSCVFGLLVSNDVIISGACDIGEHRVGTGWFLDPYTVCVGVGKRESMVDQWFMRGICEE